MPLKGIVAAIRERTIPHDKNWFAYKMSEEAQQRFLAERLGRELGLPFEPADIALTTGAFAAIMVAFRLVLDVGDEAVYSEPAWFCYEPMLLAADAVPRKVGLSSLKFDLDLGAINAAISPRTRLVIVNTPHNPTARIYSRDSLAELSHLLDRASGRNGHRIYLLSDEPYRRLRFDERGFVSPAAIYPWTLISYSYGKVLLAPGQRLNTAARWEPGTSRRRNSPAALRRKQPDSGSSKTPCATSARMSRRAVGPFATTLAAISSLVIGPAAKMLAMPSSAAA
jgi:aspartate aminotransferase